MIAAINALFNHDRVRKVLVRMRVLLVLPVGLGVIALIREPWLWWGLGVSLVGELGQLWCFANLDKQAELACRGPYAVVRNPMYIARFLIVGGALLATGWWWALPTFAILYAFYMHNRVRREERTLRPKLGRPYEEYLEGCPRFLPGRRYRGNPVLTWRWTLFVQNHGPANLAGTLAFWAAAIAWHLHSGGPPEGW